MLRQTAYPIRARAFQATRRLIVVVVQDADETRLKVAQSQEHSYPISLCLAVLRNAMFIHRLVGDATPGASIEPSSLGYAFDVRVCSSTWSTTTIWDCYGTMRFIAVCIAEGPVYSSRTFSQNRT